MSSSNSKKELRRLAAKKAKQRQMIIASSVAGLVVAGVVGFILFMPHKDSADDAQPTEQNAAVKVDEDLTPLSDTVKVAKINEIVNNPDKYAGKTVKIAGKYLPFEGRHYINAGSDQSCCFSGFEFRLNDSNNPPVGENDLINIVGVLKNEPTGPYLAIDKLS